MQPIPVPAVEGTGRESVVIVQGHSMNWCDDGVMENEITPSLRKIGLLSDRLRERLVAIAADA